MRKLSRFGAAALALALSVTFLTPVQAQAAKNENEDWLQLKEDLADSGVIDINVVSLGDIEGIETDTEHEYTVAYKKLVSIMVAKGYATTTKPLYNECISNVVDGTKYYYVEPDFDTEYFTKDGKDGVRFKDVKVTVYTNTQTKKSSVFRSEVNNNYTTDEAKARSFQSAIRVKKGEITYVAVPLAGGDTTIQNIKSSKKSIAKVSLYKKMSIENNTNVDNVRIDDVYDDTTGKTTWTVYYYTTVGAKVVVGTYDDEDKAKEAAKNAEMTASSATRYIKVDAKKSGKTKLTFNIKNKNGNVSKVSTTIHVVDDTDIFSKLTYAGQSLLADKDPSLGFSTITF